MITTKTIKKAKSFLINQWGKDGKKIIKECSKYPSLDMSCNDFLNCCYSSGGNWTGMLLSGIKKLRPSIYKCIPDKMGNNSFSCVCYVLILCGIDTTE